MSKQYFTIVKLILLLLMRKVCAEEKSLTGYFKLNLSNLPLDGYLQKSLALLQQGLEKRCFSENKTTAAVESRQYNAQYDMRPFDVAPPATNEQAQQFLFIRPKPLKLLDQLAWEDEMPPSPTPTSPTSHWPSTPTPPPTFADSTLESLRQSNKKKKQRQRRRKKRKRFKKKIKGDGNNKRKKKKKKKKQKQKQKKKPEQHVGLVGQQAHVIFATVTTEKPHFPAPIATTAAATTTTTAMPPYKKKIKYILRKHNSLKKVKKEYLSHLGLVIYPFVKFIAFFTVLNPFTFGVFFFSLISPIVFGILGFLALSFFVRPALSLLFDVKRRVGDINRRNYYNRRRRERLRDSRRPITIHKHYYQHRNRAPGRIHRSSVDDDIDRRAAFNPILPHLRDRLESQELRWRDAGQHQMRPPINRHRNQHVSTLLNNYEEADNEPPFL